MTTRNSNARFDLAPQVEIERSTFDRSCDIKTSFNVGQLVPFYVDEVLPGDTFQIETAKVARLQTLIAPVMDNLYLDTYYFFVPNRLVWSHWQNFMGENEDGSWVPDVSYIVPEVYPPENGWNTGTIADYMGLPLGVEPAEERGFNALPFRAYAKIVNDWFRDENLQDPAYINMGETATFGSNGSDYVSDLIKGGKPFIANKYHDYFTSCLPAPQKGPDVTFLNGYAPVGPAPFNLDNTSIFGTRPLYVKSNATIPNNAFMSTGYVEDIETGTDEYVLALASSGAYTANFSNQVAYLNQSFNMSDGVKLSAMTINDLRRSFQIQRLYEKDARGGTRYIELLKSHFGVTSPDARLQRAEYLGGNRVPFNIEQVLQTSSTDSTTPQGNVTGWSQTNDSNFDVNKSFVEHGFIIGLMCARYDHSYQQGVECFWKRSSRFDYYWPALAHLGEKAVFTDEIYYDGELDTDVFGYQEAWAEYKYKPNYITGSMRSLAAQHGTNLNSMDVWHFADIYDTAPQLSEEWIKEDAGNVNRAIAVTSEAADQVFIDIYVKNKCTRPMPLYSIPGLIDHF